MSISTLQKEINKQLDGCFEEMVEIRRHFHMYPELSFQEEKTAAFIASYYESLGVPIRTNVGGRGVLANIEGSEPGPTVALRADFDALPIQDEKRCPLRLQSAWCHACMRPRRPHRSSSRSGQGPSPKQT